MSQKDNSYIIERIQKSLGEPLPGQSAHLKMLPPNRKLNNNPDSVNVKQSGVLLLLFPGTIKHIFVLSAGLKV